MHRRLILLSPLALLACQTGPEPRRVVFFNADSAALDEDARRVIASAAQAAQRNPNAPVRVAGFAGVRGGQQFNQSLSEARAQAVRDSLVAAGVAAGRIQVVGRGPVQPDLMLVESRRVEIELIGI